MSSSRPIVVLKVGGSLHSMSDLGRRLQTVVGRLGDGRFLLVSGGGEAADLVRGWQPLHGLTEEQAHWLALRAVSLNEALLGALLPDAATVRNRSEMRAAWDCGKLAILAADAFLRAEESCCPDLLPHNWLVTCDTIAAWVAKRLGSRRLVLLKSCDVPDDGDLLAAAEQGLVDAHFPRCAAGLSIAWVNLRDDHPEVIEWPTEPVEH